MDSADAFFTQTIVGAPFTALMGRRRTPGQAGALEGLEVSMATGQSRLTRLWSEWIVLSHACDPVGQPRLRPGPWRIRLERHALWIALTGLAALAAAAIAWGLLLWK